MWEAENGYTATQITVERTSTRWRHYLWSERSERGWWRRRTLWAFRVSMPWLRPGSSPKPAALSNSYHHRHCIHHRFPYKQTARVGFYYVVVNSWAIWRPVSSFICGQLLSLYQEVKRKKLYMQHKLSGSRQSGYNYSPVFHCFSSLITRKHRYRNAFVVPQLYKLWQILRKLWTKVIHYCQKKGEMSNSELFW